MVKRVYEAKKSGTTNAMHLRLICNRGTAVGVNLDGILGGTQRQIQNAWLGTNRIAPSTDPSPLGGVLGGS